MAQLLSLNEWANRRFSDESRPSKQTLRRWCVKGEEPYFIKRGGTWFVDPALEAIYTGNKIVDEILADSR